MTEMRETLIAGTKTCADWLLAREQLVTDANNGLWSAVFEDYFHSRIRSRYLQPIELLRDHDAKQGEGFSMVAVHCSLVEFLESTVQGIRYRVCRNDAELGEHEYRMSAPVFVSFLTRRQPFRDMFDDALAEEFYKRIRCGLLHEACTKGGWRIRADGPAIIDRVQRILYRNKFHEALLQFVEWYRSALASSPELQEAFIRKFDSLCEEHGAAQRTGVYPQPRASEGASGRG
jgi:hypothetical protein